MDGTLVDSTAGVVGAWETFKETYAGIDVHDILSSEFDQLSATSSPALTPCFSAAHGVRTVDNLKRYCGINDPAELQVSLNSSIYLFHHVYLRVKREAQRFEKEIIKSSTRNGRKGIVNLPGAAPIIHEVR
jgi:glycerol 3-phosphatase-1